MPDIILSCILLIFSYIHEVIQMRELITRGDICLNDDYNLTYKIAEIQYTEREDETFTYEITPNYSVISLLSPQIFQGIPGLNLDLKKTSYKRQNIVPVFISERTPSKNREDLWKLLDDNNMQYLNQLEWLIRTDKRYSGDNLFVQRSEKKRINEESLTSLGNRSVVICRKLLETICYGGIVVTPSLVIDDSNRKQYFELLTALYSTERKYLDTQRKKGMVTAAKDGKYKGRKRIKIAKLEAIDVFTDYEMKKINSTVAAQRLGLSKSTFLRRYREFAKARH